MQTLILKVNSSKPQLSRIRKASEILKAGSLVAFPTETVYGLGANALNENAVRKIFKAKGRPFDNPLIVHISDKKQIFQLVKKLPKNAEKLMKKFFPGPLTIVLKKSKIVSDSVTAGLETVAVRMPCNKIALALIKDCGFPIAAPSANSFGKTSPTTAQHVFEDLNGKIPLILDGGKCRIGLESTVIDVSGKKPILLRPGKITLEQLRKVLGEVKVHSAINFLKNAKNPKAPGMKYKHYSPKAELILVLGKKQKALKKMNELLKNLKKQKIKASVFCLSGSYSKIARNLFKELRRLDSKGFETIIVHGISEKNLGLAIMNRLKRAADCIIKV